MNFKELLDAKFDTKSIVIKDIVEEVEAKDKENIENELPKEVTVNYDELKNLLSSISANNTLSDESNALITDYITKLEFQRSEDTLKTKLEEVQIKLSEGIKLSLDEATAAATKKASNRFSSFMNGLYGSVLAFEKNAGLDNYYAEAFKKQAIFVPVMNIITNMLRNILESNDRAKILAMLKTGQLVNPIVLAKYAYTVPAKVKLNSGEKLMFVPFTKEFVDSKNSVKLPDYAYQIRPFVEQGYFAFDPEDGIKLRQPLNSPFIKSFLEMLLDKTDAQNTITQATAPQTAGSQSGSQQVNQQQMNQNNQQNSGDTIGEEVVGIKDFNGLNIYEDIVNFLESFAISEDEQAAVSESVSGNNSAYITARGIKLAETAKKFDAELSDIINKRSDVYDLIKLAERRLDNYLLTPDMRSSIKEIIKEERDIHLRLMDFSEEVERYVRSI